MFTGVKIWRLIIGLSYVLILLPLTTTAQTGAGTITAQVLVREGGKDVSPGDRIRFYLSGPGDPIIAWANNDGLLRSAGHKQGKWKFSVRHKGYKLFGSKGYYVEVNSTKDNEASPKPVLVEKPTPTPTPSRTSRTPATEPPTGGATIVLVLHRTSQQQDSTPAQTSTSQPPCDKKEARSGLVVSGQVAKKDAPTVKLEDAEVGLYAIDCASQQLALRGRAHTDSNGKFTLNIPKYYPTEEHVLFVKHEGYQSYDEDFDIESNTDLDIRLDTDDSSDTAVMEVEVETVEAARRHIFTPEVMEALPVSGFRSFDTFALLVPGVLPPPATFSASGPGVSAGVGTAGIFSVNGQRSRENNFTIDGSDNNDEDIGTRRQGFLIPIPQAVESIEEFQIITALADARFGRNIGGQVNALTKTGTHGLHGSLYGFFTNDRFNARDFFDVTAPHTPASFTLRRASDNSEVLLDGRPLVVTNPATGKNQLDRKQMGLTAGGRIPWTENFFFFSGERQMLDATQESHFAVPTVRQRGLFDLGETGALELSPFLPVPRPLSPASLPGNAIFSLYPFPNNPLGPYGANTYTALLPSDGKGVRLALKVSRDFVGDGGPRSGSWWKRLLSKPAYGDSIAARYNITDERSTLPTTGGALFSSLRPKVRTQNFSVFYNRKLSSHISDSLRLSFGRTRLFFGEVLDPFLSRSKTLPNTPFLLNAPLLLNVTSILGDSARTNYITASSPTGQELLGDILMSGLTRSEDFTGPLGQLMIAGFSPVGVDVYNFPQERANNTYQAAETLTYVSNAHLLNFGIDVRKTQINSTLDRNFRPLAVFSGFRNSSAAPLPLRRPDNGTLVSQQLLSPATLAAAAVPTGLFQTLARVPNSNIGLRYTQVNMFFQDEWRVRPYFRITSGLRYEVNTVPDTVGRKIERAFDPEELNSQIQQALIECQPRPRCSDLAPALTSAFPADFTVSFGSDRNDLDFRLGFVYDPGNSGQFAIRGGISSYSGQFSGIVLGQSRNTFSDFLPLNYARFPVSTALSPTQFRYPLFNLASPETRVRFTDPVVAPGTLNAIPNTNPIVLLLDLRPQPSFSSNLTSSGTGLNLTLPQKELQTPYSFQYGVTIEGELPGGYIMSAAYVGTRGVKLLRVTTPDLGLLQNRINFASNESLLGFPMLSGDSLAPQPVISNSFRIMRTLFESSGSSTYNSLQGELRKRYRNNFQFGMAFTYSHTIDNASDLLDTAGAFALPQNSLAGSERASSSYDVRLRLVSHFIVDINEKLLFLNLGKKLGGWQIAGIVTNQTGQPFTVNSAFDINRDGNLTDRLNTTNGLIVGPVNGDNRVKLQIAPGLNPIDLLAPDGRDGMVGRNTFRANGIANVDLSITKFIDVGDVGRIHLKTEIFNLFNRTHFATPERILESPAFGASTRTALPARMIQFAIKLAF